MLRDKQGFRDAIFLLILLLVGMWPLTLSLFSMKWDMVDITLPWNYYIAECLQNQLLPLWNPFINGGFAQMGLPDTWYPVTWLISLTLGMDLQAMHFDYLFHLYLAGLGMYTLGRSLRFSAQISLLLGTAYLFSGFAIGNAQHLGWIIGAAWLPWIFYYTRQLRFRGATADAVKLAFCSFLLGTGGYPGISIVTAYCVVGFSMSWLWSLFRQKRWSLLQAYFLRGLGCGLILLSLGAVVWVAALDLAPHINRGTALSLSDKDWGILSGALPWRALATFLLPYAATSRPEFWGADLTLVNCSIGLFPLLLLVFALLQRKNRGAIRLYFGLGLFFLSIALAGVFPFRAWLYHLPLLDLFRFPTLFRIFAIFFFLLTIGYGWKNVVQKAVSLRRLRWSTWGMFLFLGMLSVIGFLNSDFQVLALLFEKGFFAFDQVAGTAERVLLQAFWGSVLMGIFIIKMRKNKESPAPISRWVLCLGLLEIVMAVQFNLNTTVITPTDPKLVDRAIARLPQAYPIPSLAITQADSKEGTFKSLPYLNYNQNCYYKIPTSDGSSPYSFKNWRQAEQSGNLSLLHHPLFFLADHINTQQQVVPTSVLPFSPQAIEIQSFSPNRVELNLNLSQKEHLIFLQNHYPHWQATVNGRVIPIRRVNDTFMAIELTADVQQVIFEFKPQAVIRAFYISLSVLTLIVLFLFLHYWKKGRYELVGLFILLGMSLLFSLFLERNKRQAQAQTYPQLQQYLQTTVAENDLLLLNVDAPQHFQNGVPSRVQRQQDLYQLFQAVEQSSAEKCYYADYNSLREYPEVAAIIQEKFPVLRQEKTWSSGAKIQEYQSGTHQHPIFQNDFETPTPKQHWTLSHLDSTTAHTGQWSNHLNQLQAYSTTFSSSLQDFGLDTAGTVNFWCYFQKRDWKECLMVLQVERAGEQIQWVAQDLRAYQQDTSTWSRALLTHTLTDVKPSDTLKVYLWNAGKGLVWVDDLKVEAPANR